MRAKMPDSDGLVTRDGVNLAYEIYGDAPNTMLFIPPWSIVHSRIYKAQLPYFSERFRCITYDGRGNGKSDRPDDVAAYSLDNYLADALAVMDALHVGQAVLVGLSFGGLLASILAAHHPERVRAAIRNSGCQFPSRRVTVNLAPADLRKAGPAYDLPIAVAVLLSSGQISDIDEPAVFLGELSLDGTGRHTNGILPMVVVARDEGYDTVFVPSADAPEAALELPLARHCVS